MSSPKMMLCLLVGAICFSLCSSTISDSLPSKYKPAVLYTSPNSAVITWEKLNKEKEMDGYIIEYGKNWQNSKVLHVSRTSNTAMIPNLEPNTLYNIRVRVPDVKNGEAHPGPSVSFRTKPVVSASIGVPQNIAVVPLPSYKLLVTWDLPFRSRASDVVHYGLVFAPFYSPYLRKTSLLLPGHYRSFRLNYLRPNTMYKVKIAALMKSRKGPYSSWVIAQTVNQVGLDTYGQRITHQPSQHRSVKASMAMTSSMRPITELIDVTEETTSLTTTITTITTSTSTSLPKQQNTEQPTESTIHQSTRLITTAREPKTTQQLRQETRIKAQQETQTTPSQSTEQVARRITQQIGQTTAEGTTLETTQKPTKQSTQHEIDNPPHQKLEPTTQSQEKTTVNIDQQTRKTTQQPTSSHLETEVTAIVGAVEGVEHTTSTWSPITSDQGVTTSGAQLYTSSSSPITSPSYSTLAISPKLVITGPLPTTASKDACEPLQPSMCSDIGYHATKMTSKGTQIQMMDQVKSMWSHLTPLCKSHAKLKQFLCAASFPYCSKNLGGPFVPCRSMCLRTMKSCSMNNVEHWPAEFDCAKFPSVGESAICISYGHESPSATTATIQNAATILPLQDTNPTTQWSPATNAPTSESQVVTTMATAVTTSPALVTANPEISKPKTPPSHCENLYLKACEGVGYQFVQFPNYFNHRHQNDAGVMISRYWPIIEVNCSPLLKLFLCSLYTPVCIDTTLKDTTNRASHNKLPCRSVCHQVTSDCDYYMKIYGFAWPDEITCDNFPDVKDDACINQSNIERIKQGAHTVLPTSPTTSKKAQVTIRRSSTNNILLTLPGAISVQQTTPKPFISTERRRQITSPRTSSRDTGRNSAARSNNIGHNIRELATVESSSSIATLKDMVKPTSSALKTDQISNTEAITQRNEKRQDFMTSRLSPVTVSASLTSGVNIDELGTTHSIAPVTPPAGCEPLYLKICNGVGYDFTQFPNFFNHTHQNDAGREVYRFWPLVEVNCSPKLQLFLCSLYAPMCTKGLASARRMTGEVAYNMLPCRSLCLQVKRECGVLMKLYGFKWPDSVQCTHFPKDGMETCLYGNTNDENSKGLFKIPKAKNKLSTKIISTPLPVTIQCQPLPVDHSCKTHYEMAALSNASESLKSVNKLIKELLSRIQDSASKKCLRNLEMFLCSLHSPRCSDDATRYGPCRSQCKTTLRRCGALLNKINIDISDVKDCRRFPMTQCTGNKRRPKTKSKSIKSL